MNRTERAKKSSTSSGAVTRNIGDARLPGLSADNKFGLAYEAAILLAKMAIGCAGYRVKGSGAHYTTFAALELAIGPTAARAGSYFDRCRRKRNELSYDRAGIVTETEAEELLREVRRFQRMVGAWIRRHHSQFA